jgi:hypothetical protein
MQVISRSPIREDETSLIHPAEGIQRTAGMTTVRIPRRGLALPHVRLTGLSPV